MDKRLKKVSSFSGEIIIPPDKSITHRAILISALANGRSTIQNPLQGEDCLSTLQCVESLGVHVKKNDKDWEIEGHGLWKLKSPNKPLDCGNSGTTMRLISGILAAQSFESELVGDESLQKRPMTRVATPLAKMGAHFSLKQDRFAPIHIKGNSTLTPLSWKNDVPSAQVKSAVLLAALHAKGKSVYEEPMSSRDHTERMLKACGVDITRDGNTITIQGPSTLQPQNWFVPGDFSSAAFFVVAGLLVPNANIKMKSVNINPTRTGLLTALQHMGAKIIIGNRIERGGEATADLGVKGRMELRGLKLEHRLVPHLIDEVPILAVAATQAKGKSVLTGLKELRVKETDRIAALAQNLNAMGARVEEKPDGMIIHGPTPLHGTAINSFADHRIAMAMGVASLIAEGETVIHESESVAISYPSFWDTLQNLSS